MKSHQLAKNVITISKYWTLLARQVSFTDFELQTWASEGGQGGHWIWKISAKGCFLSFEWEKTNFTTFGLPLEKILEKSPSASTLEKFFQRP